MDKKVPANLEARVQSYENPAGLAANIVRQSYVVIYIL
jgi:hypothetical protein